MEGDIFGLISVTVSKFDSVEWGTSRKTFAKPSFGWGFKAGTFQLGSGSTNRSILMFCVYVTCGNIKFKCLKFSFWTNVRFVLTVAPNY
jgi:hypothetical protein